MDLPVELIECIMDAAHPMPHGIIDSRHAEQRPAASTFGAMRLVCRELNDKIFKRYVETLFSVHTVMLEEPSLRALIDMGMNEHFRNALGTLFIDIREIVNDLPRSVPKETRNWFEDIIDTRDNTPAISIEILQILSIFRNLKEITIEHITATKNFPQSSQMVCMGAGAMQKRLGRRASVGDAGPFVQNFLRAIFMSLATMKRKLTDLQIRIVCREYAGFGPEYIVWDLFEQRTHELYLTTDFLNRLMHHSDYEDFDVTLRGLTTLALPIRGPPSEESEDMYGPLEGWPVGAFEPTVLAEFLSLSPNLQDLTVFFATGDDQALIDIKAAIPWANLPNLWALELGGTQFEYEALIAGLSILKGTLRNLILRHVKLNSKAEWISLIRFLHTEMDLTDFEIWEPADSGTGTDGESGLCFRNLKGKCYQPYHAWRVKQQLPENLDKYLSDFGKTKLHRVGGPACQFTGW